MYWQSFTYCYSIRYVALIVLQNYFSSNEGIIQQFWIVLKLSIIMGVPWLLDVFSAWANFDYGFEHGFVLRLCLDILNLFTVSINALKLVDRLVFTGLYETQKAVSLSQSMRAQILSTVHNYNFIINAVNKECSDWLAKKLMPLPRVCLYDFHSHC